MTAMRIVLAGAFVVFILIFGCKKSGEVIVVPPPPPPGPSITVNGFVKDLSGTPISGVAVVVTGKAPVTSGSNGAFSVAGVTTPYDIVAIMGVQNPVTMYKSLTRSDPVLLIFGITATLKSASISGNVAGTAGKRSEEHTFELQSHVN